MRLDLPADTSFLHVLRVSAVAAFDHVITDVRRLDDLRLAVDELAVASVAAAPPNSRLTVEMWSEPGAIRLVGRVPADGEVPALSTVGAMLVSTISRSHQLAREDDELVFELVMDAS